MDGSSFLSCQSYSRHITFRMDPVFFWGLRIARRVEIVSLECGKYLRRSRDNPVKHSPNRNHTKMRKNFLPLSPPCIRDEEIAEVVDTLRSDWITTGPKV